MTKSFSTQAIERPRRVVEAQNRSLGRIATEVARYLQGKHSTKYYRHVDVGCYVEVRHLSEARFTGKKFDQKVKFHYSGYPGGITERKLSELWVKKPEFVLRVMVYHMLPTNSLRKKTIKRLTVKK